MDCADPVVLTPRWTCRCVVVWQKGTITWSLGLLQNIEFSYLLPPLEATGHPQVRGGTSAMPWGVGAAGGLPTQQSRHWLLLLLKTGKWHRAGLGCEAWGGAGRYWGSGTTGLLVPVEEVQRTRGACQAQPPPSKAATGFDSMTRMLCYL